MKKKIISIMVPMVLICIGFLFIKEGKRVETINVRGIEVEIIGDKNENVEKYIKNIDYIDDYLIKNCNKIILTDGDISEEAGIDKKNAPEGANALSLEDKKEIYINTNSYDSMTMMHEFFHLLDFKYKISTNDRFINFSKKHMEHWVFSDYQYSNYQELFVGLMLNYRYNIGNLKEECPECYDIAEKIVENCE